VRGRKSPEMGSHVSQGEQKAQEISECEKKIRKIKTMRAEIALAHGVFQQPVRLWLLITKPKHNLDVRPFIRLLFRNDF
jgi:hypothetical protein